MKDSSVSKLERLAARFREYREWSRLVQKQTGKSLVTQLREIQALKQAGGQCGISDYYWYKLYDDNYQMGRGAPDFLGWRLQQQLSLALNPRLAVLPGWDKIVFKLTASSAGLPVAPIRACFHPAESISGRLGIHLKSKRAVGAYLRDPSIYPLFGKPAFSQQGYGAAHLAGYDRASDQLIAQNGAAIPVDEFLKRIDNTVDIRYHKPECGFLFQECFKPAPEIVALTNWPAICGVRIICLNGPDGVKPISASWKIAVAPNHIDNFSMGKHGNLSAHINIATGEVGRVVNGLGPQAEVLVNHPITGLPLKGFRLPGWNQLLDACHAAGTVFPLMKIHHWDFALTNNGPVMLELNDLGGVDIDQAYGHGLLTEETREFLKRHADIRAHPWVKVL